MRVRDFRRPRCRIRGSMTSLLQRAVAEVEKLPAEEQDAIAARLLAEVDDERQWDARFASTTADQWDRLVAEVAVMSPKGVRCHSTTSSHLTSHYAELDQHRAAEKGPGFPWDGEPGLIPARQEPRPHQPGVRALDGRITSTSHPVPPILTNALARAVLSRDSRATFSGATGTWGENSRIFPIGAFMVLQTWTILLVGGRRDASALKGI